MSKKGEKKTKFLFVLDLCLNSKYGTNYKSNISLRTLLMVSLWGSFFPMGEILGEM